MRTQFGQSVLQIAMEMSEGRHMVAICKTVHVRVYEMAQFLKEYEVSVKHVDYANMIFTLAGLRKIHWMVVSAGYDLQKLYGMNLGGFSICHDGAYSYPSKMIPILKSRLKAPRSANEPQNVEVDMTISLFDDRPLPQAWIECTHKISIIRWLQCLNPAPAGLNVWYQLSNNERIRVLNHLRAVGSIDPVSWKQQMRICNAESIEYADRVHIRKKRGSEMRQSLSRFYCDHERPQVIIESNLETVMRERIQALGGHAYPPPNGGNRILPSVYTTLTDIWVRSNGKQVRPADMNKGHLENTIKLLTESYNNVQARSQLLLGKMDGHFRNTKISKELRAACLEMQKVTIEEMYPIIEVLRKELSTRRPPVEFVFDLETAGLEWDDV